MKTRNATASAIATPSRIRPIPVPSSGARRLFWAMTMAMAVSIRFALPMARCFVTRTLPFPALDRLAAEHEVEVWSGPLPPTPEELRAACAGVDGLLCLLTDRVDEALLEAAPRLRAISNYAVGADNVDLAVARAHGIEVGVTPDVLTDATADLAMALILAASRRLLEAAAAVRDGGWRT